jgi:hypothetical protein
MFQQNQFFTGATSSRSKQEAEGTVMSIEGENQVPKENMKRSPLNDETKPKKNSKKKKENSSVAKKKADSSSASEKSEGRGNGKKNKKSRGGKMKKNTGKKNKKGGKSKSRKNTGTKTGAEKMAEPEVGGRQRQEREQLELR